MRLAEIEHQGLQDGVQRFAGHTDRGDVAVLERRQHGTHSEVECRKNRQTDRTNQQAKGIEPADGHRSEDCCDQARDQHNIFHRLPALVPVRLDALLAVFRLRRHVADQCCSVPIGQIQPQKKRPRNNVGSRITRLHNSPR